MKLYYMNGACSLSSRIIIEELNINCEFETFDRQTKVLPNGKSYLTVNPTGQVPALALDNGEVITENIAIMLYLADNFSNGDKLSLKNKGSLYYQLISWLSYLSSELHKSFGPFFNPKFPEEAKRSLFFKKVLEGKLDYISQQIREGNYLIGDTFTLADSYLFVILSWLGHIGFEIKNWPHLERFFNQLKERPSIQKSLNDEIKNK